MQFGMATLIENRTFKGYRGERRSIRNLIEGLAKYITTWQAL
jgi:hypothetical protein